MAEPRKTVPFRLTRKRQDLLAAEKERTGASFQKIMERALDQYLNQGSVPRGRRSR